MLTILFITIGFLSLISHSQYFAFAISPAFPNQQISDEQQDWIKMTQNQPYHGGYRPTDILAVDYFSDGYILNATLWLYFPFKDHPIDFNQVNYGMLIDSDFNNKTGYGGLDYIFEIGWRNNTNSWTQSLFALAPTQESKTIYTKYNFTGFFEKRKSYVVLPLNLSFLHYPTRYKVTFYAESQKGKQDSFITDFTRWVAIPPLELNVSTSPQSVELKKGQQETIEVRVNTTQGYEPAVNLQAESQSNLIFDFTQNDSLFIPSIRLQIPSYGIATIPLTIIAADDISVGPHTFFIFANSSFPAEELIKPKSTSAQAISSPSENIFTQSNLLAMVQQPLSTIDTVSDFWNKLGAPISFFYGIAAGISPWIYIQLKKKVKGK